MDAAPCVGKTLIKPRTHNASILIATVESRVLVVKIPVLGKSDLLFLPVALLADSAFIPFRAKVKIDACQSQPLTFYAHSVLSCPLKAAVPSRKIFKTGWTMLKLSRKLTANASARRTLMVIVYAALTVPVEPNLERTFNIFLVHLCAARLIRTRLSSHRVKGRHLS